MGMLSGSCAIFIQYWTSLVHWQSGWCPSQIHPKQCYKNRPHLPARDLWLCDQAAGGDAVRGKEETKKGRCLTTHQLLRQEDRGFAFCFQPSTGSEGALRASSRGYFVGYFLPQVYRIGGG